MSKHFLFTFSKTQKQSKMTPLNSKTDKKSNLDLDDRPPPLQNKQDHITAKDPCPPPQCFRYLRKTKSWWCEEEGEEGGEEKVHLLTHVTARGMGKYIYIYIQL